MTNILQMQEILKSIPDQRLMQEMQEPTGRAPQYLVMTEIQRRKKVRDEYQGQAQEQQTTVAEDIVGGPAPQQPPMAPAGMPPQMSQGMPPQMQPPMAAAQPPMNMEGGGALYMQEGSKASQYFGAVDLNRLVSLVDAEAGNQDLAGRRAVAAVILNRTLSDQFPDTIQAVAEQRTPGGSYQFSPLINVGGDIDKLPAGSSGTRAAVLELIADFDGKNPVGDALYFQNPEISGMIFPALRDYYDNGKRNNKPFPDGVTKYGDHIFSDSYGNEETVALEPVAFRVEDNALTNVDRKRLGTDETLKITGAGEEVIMAESEPDPVPPAAFRGSIAGIPQKIEEITGGFRGPSLAETLQQAPLPQEQLVGGLDAFIPPGRRFTTKSGAQVKAETLAGLQSPNASQPVELYDAAALAGSGEAAPVDPVAARLRPSIGAGTQPVDTGQAITPGVMSQLAEVRGASPDANLPVAGYDPGFVPEPTFGDTVSTMLASAVPPPTKKREELFSDPKNYLVDQYKRFATELADKTRVAPQYETAAPAAAPDPNVDSTEFARLGRETAPIDPIQAQSAGANIPSAGAMEAAFRKQTQRPEVAAGQLVEGTDLDGVTEAASAASGTGTPAAAPTGGMADLLAQIQAGRDDAKAMGLLTAGLGIMQQASQPGATLLSSIPGAAAGVKQYSADKSTLAKQQLALATLANQQRATEIAAEKAATGTDFNLGRTQALAAVRRSPKLSAKYLDAEGQPTLAFEEYAAQTFRSASPLIEQRTLQTEALAYKNWLAGQGNIALKTRLKIKADAKANNQPVPKGSALEALVNEDIRKQYNKWRSGVLGTNTGTRTKSLSAYETKQPAG